jgi:tetratricopeptide (TPR) repeat protein
MDVNWYAACVLSEAAALVGARQAGADLYTLLEPHAALFPVVARAVAGLGSADCYLGRLAGLLGRHAEAVAWLRRALEENERTGASARAADALLHLGDALAHAGEIDAACLTIHEAVHRAEQLDMPGLTADAHRRLTALAR